MFLKKLRIQNYKSLRDVTFEPTPFSVIIGPNGAGKTNFADAIDFLGLVYGANLQLAVRQRKSGLNFVFTREEATSAPIAFEVSIQASGHDFNGLPISRSFPAVLNHETFVFDHRFSFGFKDISQTADFEITSEEFSIFENAHLQQRLFYFNSNEHHSSDQIEIQVVNPLMEAIRGALIRPSVELIPQDPTQAIFFHRFPFHRFGPFFASDSLEFNVFDSIPFFLKNGGVISSDAMLERSGQNLPAAVKVLQDKYPDAWHIVMETMNFLWPQLEEIELAPLPDRTWGLYFKESGVGRSWRADEVSDGTIRTLAMLVAAADPRSTLVVIEEPENSIHPWVLHALVDAFRKLSARKNIILTTHSPVLIDRLYPEEVFVMSRRDGESRLDSLNTIDPELRPHWLEGEIRLSSYLESGAIEQAVPGGAR